MSETNKLIKAAFERANISYSEFEKRSGIPKSSLQRYVTGETQKISTDKLIKIANALNVDPFSLFDFDTASEVLFEDAIRRDRENKLKSPIITDDNVSFPVIGELAAGYEHIAMEDWSGDTIEIPESYLKGRKREDYLVLSVKGDSMYPHYQNGDKVLILKQDCINESGDIAAVIYDGEYATLKKVEYKKDAVRLLPLNPEYMPKEISGADLEQFKIIGIPRLLVRDIED